LLIENGNSELRTVRSSGPTIPTSCTHVESHTIVRRETDRIKKPFVHAPAITWLKRIRSSGSLESEVTGSVATGVEFCCARSGTPRVTSASAAAPRRRRARAAIIAIVLCIIATRPLASQRYARLDLSGFIETGGEADRYLRVLQDAGLVPLTPWSIQPFAPTQAKKLRAKAAEHPWRAQFDDANDAANASNGLHVLRPQARVIGNSAFPFQDGSGPTWAGRGLTGSIQLGALASWDFAYAQVAPLAFGAQNLAFPLAPNGQTGALRFADPRFPLNIDAPQRFGDRGYAQLDPGSSSLFLDDHGVVIGATTAPQRWGPAREYPLVLGPNAGGFPTVFAGTSTPLDLWLFRLHTRLVYSRLGQSSFSPYDSAETERLGSGVVATIEPRGVPGLELGGTRFAHNPWPDRGVTVTELLRPFSANNLFGSVANNIEGENQVASVFARWVLPAARTEFYGEMYREDFPGRFRSALSLVEKPDDLAAFTLGFQRVWFAGDQRLRVVHGEIVNSQVSHQERDTRGFTIPIPPYTHTFETQGHTVDGLILGSPEAYGGAAWRLGFDDYRPDGRTSISLERSMRFDWLPTLTMDSSLVHPDVIYALRVDALRFFGNDQLGLSLIPAIDLNRNLVSGNTVFNVAIAITFRRWL
jgi:hypothetical protein